MNILQRHSWALKFEKWLDHEGFRSKSLEWQRAGGKCQLLALGQIEAVDRPIIVFLHGLGNDALFPNLALYKHLLSSGYNIITSDIDGHGKYSSSVFDVHEVRSFTADLIDRLDEIVIGRPRLHLCGYSFGGCLMVDFAVHNPERVQSLSLIGLPIHLGLNFLAAAELLSPLKASYIAALKDYGLLGIHPAVGPFFRNRYPVRLGARGQGNYFEVAGKVIANINPLMKLQLVTFPTLYIAGSLDFIAKDNRTDAFLESLKIQRFYLEGETHFTTMLSPKLPRRIEVLLRNAP